MLLINWGEPERGPHDAVYGDFVCLSCCLFVRMFTFHIYLCSNSTHAQNFSHLCVYVYLRVRVGVRRVEVHRLHLRTRINQFQYRSL